MSYSKTTHWAATIVAALFVTTACAQKVTNNKATVSKNPQPIKTVTEVKTKPTVKKAKPIAKTKPKGNTFQQGMASWYGPGFHNRLTANGERYNMNAMTAAHKSLPFGTMVTVQSVRTGKTVTVRINDRGPFVKGRVIDLSRAAAKKLGMHKSGVQRVKLYRKPAKIKRRRKKRSSI